MITHVIAVGKVRDGSCRALCEDYARRIARFAPLSIVEVRDARGDRPDEARAREGERILERVPAGGRVVLLDERGRDLGSRDLARWIEERAADTRDLVFVVGGPNGVADAVRDRADDALRLSAMTLPHELARVVLFEQVYRAWTILRGSKYHND